MRRAVALVAAAALVAGCIGGDDGEPSDGGGPAGTVPADTMRIGLAGPLVVDPAEASLASASDLMVLDLLHDGLTRMDDTGTAQPALASGWDRNATSTSYRFVLAADAAFTNGDPVTPLDVIASLQRVMAEGDSSLAALSLESIKGFRAFADGKAKNVSGLTAPGPNTVRIELTTPMSVLPAVLSSPLLSVIDVDTIDGDVGELELSGDWAVSSAEDERLVVESRDPAAALRRVQLQPHDDQEAAYADFERGAVDWAEIPASDYDASLEEYGADAFAPFQAELFFGMNVSSAALKSAPLREAIAKAIDRDAIVEAVYADLADPLTTVVPAGIAGHDAARCRDCEHDPERATEIVTFAFPDGKVPTVRIDFDESPVQQEMAEMVAADLDDVGIPTELRPKPLEEYKSFVVSGDQELFSFGWIGAYRSPDAYLAPLFGSSANDNLTNYRSDQVDGLLERARASTNGEKNADRWALAERTVLEADVVVPIAQFRTQAVLAERVQGFVHAVDGTVDWTRVSLDS